MVLRETLLDGDIPRRDMVRENIINRWRQSFKVLRRDLSVSFSVSFFNSTN